jgi:hypothetical protein
MWPALVAILVVGAAACGGTHVPASSRTTQTGPAAPLDVTAGSVPTTPSRPPASAPETASTRPPATPTTTPRNTTPTTTAPVPPTASLSLHSLVPNINVLGYEWVDDGDQPTSSDLTNPPSACALFTPVFNDRVETPCAEATAVKWFVDTENGTIDSVSARIVRLTAPGSNVIWRVTIVNHTSNGVSHTFYLDIGYFARGTTLVKIRISSCGCRPPVAADAELLSGELNGLRAIGSRLQGETSA